MKKLLFILPAYLIITTALSVMEVSDRLEAHYVAKNMAAIELALPEHLKTALQ